MANEDRTSWRAFHFVVSHVWILALSQQLRFCSQYQETALLWTADSRMLTGGRDGTAFVVDEGEGEGEVEILQVRLDIAPEGEFLQRGPFLHNPISSCEALPPGMM